METENIHIDIDLLTRYLAAETNENERKAVDTWIAVSVENQREFERLKKTWDSLNKTNRGSEINIEREWEYQQNLNYRSSKKQEFISLPRAIRIAASIIILIGLGLAGIRFFSTNTLKTKASQTREILLADGSKVTLNAGSRLIYNRSFNTKDRVVRLVGEAYFEVEKNPDKPFIIRLGEAEVKVLGTSFNVKAYKGSDNIEVTVNEGTVSLYEKSQELKQVVATKGEKAEYNKEQKFIRKTVNRNQNFIAWKTRTLVFRDDNLSTVINTLNEVYHKEFVLSDSALSACTITTQFENKDLESVLRILESTLDITFEQAKDKFVISGKGCN